MATQHTALEDLPVVLEGLGLRVVDMAGWLEAQGKYLWSDLVTGAQGYDLPPSTYMVHHTAGSAARPVVRDTSGRWSVANAWVGLDDGTGRLTQSGAGVPTIYLTSSGPARVSAGYGYKPATESAAQGIRPPWRAEGPDSKFAANRYAYSLEIVHRGDGSAIDPGVWEHVVGLGIALHDLLGWSGEHTYGHVSHTRRKIDPNVSVGLPHDGPRSIIDIQDAIAGSGGTPPDPPPSGANVYLPIVHGDGFNDNPARRTDVEWLQIALARAGQDPGAIDGRYGDRVSGAVAALPDVESDGRVYGPTEHDALLRAAYTAPHGEDHTHDLGGAVPIV